MVQLTLSLEFLGYFISSLVVGPPASLGRRPVLLAGSCVFVAGSLLCAAAPTLPALLAGRVLQGLGVAAPTSLAMTIIRRPVQGGEAGQAVLPHEQPGHHHHGRGAPAGGLAERDLGLAGQLPADPGRIPGGHPGHLADPARKPAARAAPALLPGPDGGGTTAPCCAAATSSASPSAWCSWPPCTSCSSPPSRSCSSSAWSGPIESAEAFRPNPSGLIRGSHFRRSQRFGNFGQRTSTLSYAEAQSYAESASRSEAPPHAAQTLARWRGPRRWRVARLGALVLPHASPWVTSAPSLGRAWARRASPGPGNLLGLPESHRQETRHAPKCSRRPPP